MNVKIKYFLMRLTSIIWFLGSSQCLTAANLSQLTETQYVQVNEYAMNRIISNFSLFDIFPQIKNSSHQLFTRIEQDHQSSNGPSVNYSLLNTESEIFFFAFFKQPIKSKVNLILSTNYLDESRFEKRIEVTYNIQKLNYDINVLLEFTVVNTTLQQVLDSEASVLRHFRTHLWRKQGIFLLVDNDYLNIVSITPHKTPGSFTFVVGNSGLNDQIREFETMRKENLNTCDSVEWHVLTKFTEVTSLKIDLCSIVISTVVEDTSIRSSDEMFELNAFYNIHLSDGRIKSNWFQENSTSIKIAFIPFFIISFVFLKYVLGKFSKSETQSDV